MRLNELRQIIREEIQRVDNSINKRIVAESMDEISNNLVVFVKDIDHYRGGDGDSMPSVQEDVYQINNKEYYDYILQNLQYSEEKYWEDPRFKKYAKVVGKCFIKNLGEEKECYISSPIEFKNAEIIFDDANHFDAHYIDPRISDTFEKYSNILQKYGWIKTNEKENFYEDSFSKNKWNISFTEDHCCFLLKNNNGLEVIIYCSYKNLLNLAKNNKILNSIEKFIISPIYIYKNKGFTMMIEYSDIIKNGLKYELNKQITRAKRNLNM